MKRCAAFIAFLIAGPVWAGYVEDRDQRKPVAIPEQQKPLPPVVRPNDPVPPVQAPEPEASDAAWDTINQQLDAKARKGKR